MTGLLPWRRKSNEVATRRGQNAPQDDFAFSLSRMRDDFDRLFERMARDFSTIAGSDGGGWQWGLDVEDQENQIVVRAEAPGFDAEDFDIRVEDHHLVLRAAKKSEQKDDKGELKEYTEQQCYEMVALPAGIDKEKVDAQYRNGVLTVTLAKTEEGRPKRIAVKSS